MIITYLLFIGEWLYFIATMMFLYLFIKTIRATDGIGLTFLRAITLGTAVGSFVVFLTRHYSEKGTIDLLTGRAIAVVNPIILVGIALYLNYLFHRRDRG